MVAAIEVIDVCQTGNYIVSTLQTSGAETVDFIINSSDQVVRDIPFVYDYSSEFYGNPDLCGTITTTMSVEQNNVVLPNHDFVTFDGAAITVFSDDTNQRGTYRVKLTHTLNAVVTLTETIMNLHIIDQCIDNNSIVVNQVDYATYVDFILGIDEPLTLNLPYVSDAKSDENNNPGQCGEITVTMTVELDDTYLATNPDFMFLDSETNTLAIDPSSTTQTGFYYVHLEYALVDYPDVTYHTGFFELFVIDRCASDNYINVPFDTATSTAATSAQFSYIINYDQTVESAVPVATDAASDQLGVPDFCSTIQYNLVVERDGTRLDDTQTTVVYDPTSLIVSFSTTDIADAGYYVIYMEYSLTDYPDIVLTWPIAYVDAYDRCSWDNSLVVDNGHIAALYDYTINISDSISLDLATVQDQASIELEVDNFCGSISTSLVIEKDAVEVAAADVSFINFNSYLGTISIATSNSNDRGYYTLRLRHTLDSDSTVTLYRKLTDIHVIDQCFDQTYLTLSDASFSAATADYILNLSDTIYFDVPTVTDTLSDTTATTNVCGEYTVSLSLAVDYVSQDLASYDTVYYEASSNQVSFTMYDDLISNNLTGATTSTSHVPFLMTVTYSLVDYPEVTLTMDLATVYVINACESYNYLISSLGDATTVTAADSTT